MQPRSQIAALECRSLGVTRGARTVLRDISLSIRADEAIALIGPNGAGKSTLLLALMGLVPRAGGDIRLLGRDLQSVAPRDRAALAAYVPQFLDVVPDCSVFDVVAGGRFRHVGPLHPLAATDREAIRTAMHLCGVDAFADRSLRKLSGGERQKTLLAAALAQDAQMLFLDEPASSLDPPHQSELVQLLRDWRSRGRGFVMVSHDMRLPALLADRVIGLRDGRIAADGPAPEVLQPAPLMQIFGGAFSTFIGPDGERVALPQA